MKLFSIFASIAISLFSFPYVAYAQDHLPGADITKSVVGPKLSSKTRSGKPFIVTFTSDGKGVMDIGKIGKFDATWHVDGDKMCWKIPNEAEECSFVVAGKGKLTFVDAASGKTNNIYSVK